ncbi:MAG: nuclear transport factor 2 family protein [Spirosoma sp.]|nr:nuclear transport factor 2 family protein [Spirosoma sp.]
MKTNQFLPVLAALAALFVFVAGCNAPAKTENTSAEVSTSNNTDMTAVKAQIQAKETAFAAAVNAQNADAVATMYANDAISMGDASPADTGPEAIKKAMTVSFAKRKQGAVTTYEVQDVYGSEKQVTEVGKTTIKDADGTVSYTGKYMAVWEKRNGGYVCIRDISNSDAPPAPASEKSIHVFDMPKDITEARWAATIRELNAVIAKMGYPGAGYVFYKTSDNSVKNNRYYFEGVWPAGDGYRKIHEDPAFIEASKKLDPLYAKIKAVELYRRVSRVD